MADTIFKLLGEYHKAVYPMPYIFIILALIIFWLLFSEYKYKNIFITTILGFFWFWSGLVLFTMHVASFMPLTYALQGVLFPIQGLLFFHLAFSSKNLECRYQKTFVSGFGLLTMFFAVFIYPIIGNFTGHFYPEAPVFGDPCPLTIFTLGLFLTSVKKVELKVYLIPFFWAMMGFVAVFKLGIYVDIAEIIFGFISLYLLVRGVNINDKTNAVLS